MSEPHDKRGFLQVVSLFGVPLAVIIWYEMLWKTGGYQLTFSFRASRPLAIGIYLLTAFLCLHTPLRLWRRFDAMSLRLFCLMASLATFWLAVRLASSGRAEQAPLLKSAAVFLIPVAMYVLLSRFLFKWSRDEFVEVAAAPDPVQGSDAETKSAPRPGAQTQDNDKDNDNDDEHSDS